MPVVLLCLSLCMRAVQKASSPGIWKIEARVAGFFRTALVDLELYGVLPASAPEHERVHPPSALSEFLLLLSTWAYRSLVIPVPKGSGMTPFCCFVLGKP